ncbi:MAG: GNAT family N-acetyltransferase [Vibrio sp.]
MDMHITPITTEHDAAIREIIETVGSEYGAIGEGFGPSDPEVQAMSEHYHTQLGCQYYVACKDGKVLGGGGIAPFLDSASVCELRKVFLSADARGQGVGKQLVLTCLDFARQAGYTHCYLDTLSGMKGAIALYERLGFQHRSEPMPGVVHTGCDIWMDITL